MLKICGKLRILIFFMICAGQDSHEGKQCCNTGGCCWQWQWTHLACPACLFCDCFAFFRTLANIPSWSKKIEWSLSRTAESRARKTSLWKQRCVPSEQESNLRYAGAALILLVGIYKPPRCLKTMAVVSSLETKCINWQPTAVAQIFRVPKKSTTLNMFQPCSTERYTISNQWVRINAPKTAIPMDIFAPWEVCGDVFRGCLQLFHHCGWCRWRLGRFWNWSPVPLRCFWVGKVEVPKVWLRKMLKLRKNLGKWKREIR